jgi:hypothetical protein
MAPDDLAHLRAELGTIGVAVSRYRAEREFATPAKGWSGGFARGFSAGASAPILVGFLAPVPGGTFAGCLVAPFTGLYGGFRGASRAHSVEEVDRATDGIDAALDRLAADKLRSTTLEPFVRFAGQRCGRSFVALPGRGPKEKSEIVRYDRLGLEGIDTVLEVRVEKGGLWGRYEVDPPSAPYLEARVRLIRVSDNKVLLEDVVMCLGEQRPYEDWGESDGRIFYDEIRALIPRLQKKVVDDLFRVYPLGGD